MSFTRDWSLTIPIDHTKFKTIPSDVRNVRTDLGDRLASILYGFTAGETIPGIKLGRLITVGTGVATTPPGTGAAASVDIYSRSDGTGSAVELYSLDGSGNETQITKAGKLNTVELDATLASWAGIMALIYPVGSVYTNATDSTNRGTLLGFGTWAAVGEGRVLVGKAGSGTFATAGGTGGAETTTLTAAQSGLPAHLHKMKAGSGGVNNGVYNYASSNDTLVSSDVASDNVAAANASEAHTNLQPFLVVYLWVRTA
jgi:hypothetical protein